MRKKLVPFILCILLLIPGTAAAASWPSWAASAETWAIQKGLSETFTEAPSMAVTRGQIAQILYEAAGRPAVSDEVPFIDLPEMYIDAVTWAAANGFVQGVGEERYLPNRLVTRQEFAVMLYRAAGSPQPYAYTLAGYTDAEDVAQWAWDAMRWCTGTGLMKGKTSELLEPLDTITVAEAVLMLQRADTDSTAAEAAAVSTLDELQAQLLQAITAAKQPPVFDVHALTNRENLEIDVQNLYNTILSDQPELKYAYDLQATCTDDLLHCTFSYMPYHTGSYPPGFEGVPVSDLQELIQAARENLDTPASTPIRITNPTLTVDDMNKALQQAGGSYILCQLNQDGTAITYTALNDLSYDECLSRLERINALADTVIAEQVDRNMSRYEQAEALYTYLTETVLYDHRYYSDRTNMPYDSQTAYGALQKHLAICGGYAQALQVLFEKIDIPCYTVSGRMGGEYHMWNIAYLDGTWGYFDATSDRGRADYWFNCFNVAADQLTQHEWDAGFVQRLAQADAPEA